MINTYDEALDRIYSYVDYSMTHVSKVSRQDFSLEPTRKLLKKLGDPQNAFAVIHVAGTKGKGSVCAMLAAALTNAGFKTGLYTSPHLLRFNERIQVNGKMITDQEIIDLTNRIDEKVRTMEHHASSFEFMTAMAFEYFREQRVDIAVVETGLGGRLDSTNVVDPILTIITSVSKDHTDFLGDTIEKIAREKAGIIKKGVPVICGTQPYKGAAKVIEETAHQKSSPWVYIPERYQFINQRSGLGMQSMHIWRVEDQKLMEKWCRGESHGFWEPAEIEYPLAGLHQMENTAIVYAALQKIRFRFSTLNVEKALEGIKNTFWPCRFETVSQSPLMILDGAHNEDSMEKLGATIDRYCGSMRVKCIFGASEDKRLRSMITLLAPHVDEFIMTRSTHPRAADPELLADLASETGRKNSIAPSLEDAYACFKQETDNGVCWLVTGSLFVTGGIREIHMKEDPSVRYFPYNE